MKTRLPLRLLGFLIMGYLFASVSVAQGQGLAQGAIDQIQSTIRHDLKGGNSSARKILSAYNNMISNIKAAGKYVKGSAKYIAKLYRAFDYARDIGNYLNDLALGRDRILEEAYDKGYSIGIRDAKRFYKDPAQGWIDVDYGAKYERLRSNGRAVYNGAWAIGWADEMQKHY